MDSRNRAAVGGVEAPMRGREMFFALTALALVVSSCSSGAGGGRADEENATDVPATRPPFGTMPPLPSVAAGSGSRSDIPEAAWSAVVADLDARLDGVDPDEIEVVSVEEVTWNNGALGCPEPGQVYTQALVDGQRVIVSVDGTRYDYRIAGSSIRLCT